MGWQVQPDQETIQGCLQKALSQILRETILVTGAGRTDTGVHAVQMYAHFDTSIDCSQFDLTYKVNAILANDIVVHQIFEVDAEAHARFDAVSRAYEYRIYLGRSPFNTQTTYQIHHQSFDINLMNKAANILLKHRNFKCFSRSNTDVKTYECDMMEAFWKKENQNLIFHIKANRFLRNMVRAIVGTLLDVGRGQTSLEDLQSILLSQNRSQAGKSAPAKGLFLTEVNYPTKTVKNER